MSADEPRCPECGDVRPCRDRKGRPMACLDCALEGLTGPRRWLAAYRWSLRVEETDEDRYFMQLW